MGPIILKIKRKKKKGKGLLGLFLVKWKTDSTKRAWKRKKIPPFAHEKKKKKGMKISLGGSFCV